MSWKNNQINLELKYTKSREFLKLLLFIKIFMIIVNPKLSNPI